MGSRLPAAVERGHREGSRRSESPETALPREQRHRPGYSGLPTPRHRRGAHRRQGRLSAGARIHRSGDAELQGPHQVLRRLDPLVQPLPDRVPDRDRVPARGEIGLRRQRRDRSNGSPGVHRHQLGAFDKGRRHRGNGAQYQPRGRGGNSPATSPARRGWSDRHRLHRHGLDQEPTCGGVEDAGSPADGPGPRTDWTHLEIRFDGDVPTTPPPVAGRIDYRSLPALYGPGTDPRHQVAGAVDSPRRRGGVSQGTHFDCPHQGPVERRRLSAERETPGSGRHRTAYENACRHRAGSRTGDAPLRHPAHPRRYGRYRGESTQLRVYRTFVDLRRTRNSRDTSVPDRAGGRQGRTVRAATTRARQALAVPPQERQGGEAQRRTCRLPELRENQSLRRRLRRCRAGAKVRRTSPT